MNQRSRLILGAVLGAVVFTIYTLVAQYVNAWALPGVGCWDDPPGWRRSYPGTCSRV
jgi:hypothetical protein